MKKMTRILLIDDDTITNYINERLITKLGICKEVIVAHNGFEGLAWLRNIINQNNILPDLILLDINMPVMNGIEFLDAFKKFNFKAKRAVKILLLTTSANSQDMEKVKALGINGIVNKPLTEEKIRECLVC